MRGNERMVKCLTINVHAWMEAEPLKKLVDLAEHILAEKYDLICLQEVNQLMESKAARELLAYQEIRGRPVFIRITLHFYWLNIWKSRLSLTIGHGLIIILAMINTTKA